MNIKCNKCKGYGCDCYPINQSNKTVTVPLAGTSAFQGYKAYNPDSEVTEKGYYNGEVFESNFYTEDEL